MTKDESIKKLTDAKVSLELTKAGELTADQLELMANGLDVPELQKQVLDLNGELTKAQEDTRVAKKENPRLKRGGRVFELVIAKSSVRFHSERRAVTEKTLREDEALLDYCIKIGAGCLKDVTPEKSKK